MTAVRHMLQRGTKHASRGCAAVAGAPTSPSSLKHFQCTVTMSPSVATNGVASVPAAVPTRAYSGLRWHALTHATGARSGPGAVYLRSPLRQSCAQCAAQAACIWGCSMCSRRCKAAADGAAAQVVAGELLPPAFDMLAVFLRVRGVRQPHCTGAGLSKACLRLGRQTEADGALGRIVNLRSGDAAWQGRQWAAPASGALMAQSREVSRPACAIAIVTFTYRCLLPSVLTLRGKRRWSASGSRRLQLARHDQATIRPRCSSPHGTARPTTAAHVGRTVDGRRKPAGAPGAGPDSLQWRATAIEDERGRCSWRQAATE